MEILYVEWESKCFVRVSCAVSLQHRVHSTMCSEVAHGVFVQQESQRLHDYRMIFESPFDVGLIIFE